MQFNITRIYVLYMLSQIEEAGGTFQYFEFTKQRSLVVTSELCPRLQVRVFVAYSIFPGHHRVHNPRLSYELMRSFRNKPPSGLANPPSTCNWNHFDEFVFVFCRNI